MGKVVRLEDRKVRALADTLEPVLCKHGSLVVGAADVEDVDMRRRAARLAGRRMGWRIRRRYDDFPEPVARLSKV